jgi:hypothetical protein
MVNEIILEIGQEAKRSQKEDAVVPFSQAAQAHAARPGKLGHYKRSTLKTRNMTADSIPGRLEGRKENLPATVSRQQVFECQFGGFAARKLMRVLSVENNCELNEGQDEAKQP